MTVKTTVYLPEELKARVAAEAVRRGVAEAEVIRSVLDAGIGLPPPVVGIFEHEPFAADADELLAGFGER